MSALEHFVRAVTRAVKRRERRAPSRAVMECSGSLPAEAWRRRERSGDSAFRRRRIMLPTEIFRAGESGGALRWPPQAKLPPDASRKFICRSRGDETQMVNSKSAQRIFRMRLLTSSPTKLISMARSSATTSRRRRFEPANYSVPGLRRHHDGRCNTIFVNRTINPY